MNAFTQVTNGSKPDDLGGFHEAIADPWGERHGGVNWMGSVYLNELALDFMLQLQVAGVQPSADTKLCTRSLSLKTDDDGSDEVVVDSLSGDDSGAASSGCSLSKPCKTLDGGEPPLYTLYRYTAVIRAFFVPEIRTVACLLH